MTGHRAFLTAAQVRALAKPIRFEPLKHNPNAGIISGGVIHKHAPEQAA